MIFNGPKDPHGYGQEVPPTTNIDVGDGVEIVMGHVEHIHGEEGRPVPEYIITWCELLELARFWATEWLDVETWCTLHQCSGSSEIREIAYGQDRVSRIADLLGDAAVDPVVGKVWSDLLDVREAEAMQMVAEDYRADQGREFLKNLPAMRQSPPRRKGGE